MIPSTEPTIPAIYDDETIVQINNFLQEVNGLLRSNFTFRNIYNEFSKDESERIILMFKTGKVDANLVVKIADYCVNESSVIDFDEIRTKTEEIIVLLTQFLEKQADELSMQKFLTSFAKQLRGYQAVLFQRLDQEMKLRLYRYYQGTITNVNTIIPIVKIINDIDPNTLSDDDSVKIALRDFKNILQDIKKKAKYEDMGVDFSDN